MATAVEEQAMASQDVNRQVAEISNLANRSLERTQDSAENIRSSQRVSEQPHELANRFRQ